MSNTPDLMKEWRDTVAELKSTLDGDVQKLQSADAETKNTLDKINEKLDSLELEVKKKEVSVSPEVERSQAIKQFKGFLLDFSRGERSSIGKDAQVKGYHPMMETKSDNLVRFDFAAAGALLIPDIINDEIIKNVTEVTPLMDMARMTRVGAANYKRRARTSLPGGTWLAEEVANTKTKPTYATIDITPHKWAARYGWTIEQQEDAAYNLVSELVEAYREDSEVDFGNAFLNGDGIGKPFGLIGRVSNFNSGALTLSTNQLIQMQESLLETYQDSAQWLMTRKTRGYVRSLVLSATNGLQYTWEPDFQRRGPTILLGNPVRIARDADMAGLFTGNFTAAQVPIIYGDFARGYEIAMRNDNYIIDDPYTEASSFVRNFHIMSRLGGNVIKSEAIVQMTITNS
jgi:HK97 family phage major capsid protein